MTTVAQTAPAARIESVRARQLPLFLALLALGVVATASAMLMPVEVLVPRTTGLSPMMIRCLSLIQPMVLMILMVAAGCWAAPKLGLDAPLIRAAVERQPLGPILRRQAGAAIAVGLIVAAMLVVFGWVSADWFRGSPAAGFRIPLATKVLYGGITEELLMRWGLMSLLAWLAWKVTGSRAPVPAACLWAAAIVGAAIFAVGHLPVLYFILPSPPAAAVTAVLIANGVPGLLFGWLFWKRGLEAAMMAHALAHLAGSLAAAWLLG